MGIACLPPRFRGLPVKIPPLDERRDEIAEWARFMAVRRHRESVPGGEVRMLAGAARLLAEHTWPGNCFVRRSGRRGFFRGMEEDEG